MARARRAALIAADWITVLPMNTLVPCAPNNEHGGSLVSLCDAKNSFDISRANILIAVQRGEHVITTSNVEKTTEFPAPLR